MEFKEVYEAISSKDVKKMKAYADDDIVLYTSYAACANVVASVHNVLMSAWGKTWPDFKDAPNDAGSKKAAENKESKGTKDNVPSSGYTLEQLNGMKITELVTVCQAFGFKNIAQFGKKKQYYIDKLKNGGFVNDVKSDTDIGVKNEPDKAVGKSKDAATGDAYADMTARELYGLCRDRDLDVLTKQAKTYYIDKLIEDDNDSEAVGGSDSGDDEWGESDASWTENGIESGDSDDGDEWNID